MLTERTTKKLIEDSYRKCFYTDSEASDQELIWSDSAEDRLNQVWVLKEDVIKAIMRLPNDNRRYILLKELNSPPDDGIRADSVLKKDSEEGISNVSTSEGDNNNIRCKKHNILLDKGQGGSTFFYYCKTCDLEKAYFSCECNGQPDVYECLDWSEENTDCTHASLELNNGNHASLEHGCCFDCQKKQVDLQKRC